ncbi:hypothetical protein [Microvirga roseola]|uniref:hypothetical protein n=1 Tax=Microvirga roseola TaxID=2883126 RepID=UPI001E4F0C1E|nr:hypothetical protein [Microvirga roseola]
MLKAFVAVIATFAALWVALFIWDQTESGKVDYCLDAGGAWDYEQGRCEGARPGYDGP